MKSTFFLLPLLLSLLAGKSQSQNVPYKPGVALVAHAGTAGYGIGISKSLSRQLALRVGINQFTYKGTLTSGKATDELQIGFDYTIRLLSFNGLIDYYPFKRAGFHLTAGAYVNQNEVTFFGKPTKDVRFNDVVFTIDQVGTVSGKASFAKVAPYAGIGWGHPFLRNRFKVMADVGFFYQQSPSITLTTTGMLEPSSDQAPVIENNLKPLKYYPVISLGLAYNFLSTSF
ncbi:hypothetical protein [Spirosoma terrae]|uniref:Outer membrane beta-barrel protein n=1 Tax=Spirosoma terrae TaxID=1968276 RepID=A0A6L9LCD4_9BACT|nr:hypothetical protein [Spirosoma terrae]NDU98215.1 hypothetical protein [Spirosoma terrae]